MDITFFKIRKKYKNRFNECSNCVSFEFHMIPIRHYCNYQCAISDRNKWSALNIQAQETECMYFLVLIYNCAYYQAFSLPTRNTLDF